MRHGNSNTKGHAMKGHCELGSGVRAWFVVSYIVAALTCVSCGGGSAKSTNPGQLPVSVSISPKTATMEAGQSDGQTFTASVSGSTNRDITWSIQEGPAGGTTNVHGNQCVYYPPQTTGAFHLVATSQADNTKSDVATITVTVGLTISPTQVDLGFGEMQSFTAVVIGSSNDSVTWRVQEEIAGGTITNQGVYTAPQTPGTFHVIATSVADPTVTATAEVIVASVTVSIYPSTDTLGPNGVRQFTALVVGTGDGVSWSIEEGSSGGSITNDGLYTAPTTQGT